MRKLLIALLQAVCLGIPLSAWAACPSPDDVGYAKGRMYEHIDCGGWYAGLSSTSAVADMRHMSGNNMGANINDMISSIVLGSGVKCTFFADINYRGASFQMTRGTQPNLVKIGWNDRISSYKCVPWNQ